MNIQQTSAFTKKNTYCEGKSLEYIGIEYNLSNQDLISKTTKIYDFNDLHTDLINYAKEYKEFDNSNNNINQDIYEIYKQIAKCIEFIRIDTGHKLTIQSYNLEITNENIIYDFALSKQKEIKNIKEQLNKIINNIQYLKDKIIKNSYITIETINGLLRSYQTIIFKILTNNNEQHMSIHRELELLICSHYKLLLYIAIGISTNNSLSLDIKELTNNNKSLCSRIEQEQTTNRNIMIGILSICILFLVVYIVINDQQDELKDTNIIN